MDWGSGAYLEREDGAAGHDLVAEEVVEQVRGVLFPRLEQAGEGARCSAEPTLVGRHELDDQLHEDDRVAFALDLLFAVDEVVVQPWSAQRTVFAHNHR